MHNKLKLSKAAVLFTHMAGWLRRVNYLWWQVTKAANFFLDLSPLGSLLKSPGPQGEPCLMGVKRIYRKLKPTSRCVMGKTYSVSMTSGPCDCTEADFEW